MGCGQPGRTEERTCPSRRQPLWAWNKQNVFDLARTGQSTCPYCATVYYTHARRKRHPVRGSQTRERKLQMNNLEKTARIAVSLAFAGGAAALLLGYTMLAVVSSTEA